MSEDTAAVQTVTKSARSLTARVEWLPVGHVPHGYRRAFVVYEGPRLRHIVNVSHMPYELVFQVREFAGEGGVEDPSLWWGLSIVALLVADGTLLGPANPETADDGFVQVRPKAPTERDLIPLPLYQRILHDGAFVFSH